MNEAAEWLLHRIDMIGESANLDVNMKGISKDLDEALAAERRATVERIRAALGIYATEDILAILDAEAER